MSIFYTYSICRTQIFCVKSYLPWDLVMPECCFQHTVICPVWRNVCGANPVAREGGPCSNIYDRACDSDTYCKHGSSFLSNISITYIFISFNKMGIRCPLQTPALLNYERNITYISHVKKEKAYIELFHYITQITLTQNKNQWCGMPYKLILIYNQTNNWGTCRMLHSDTFKHQWICCGK